MNNMVIITATEPTPADAVTIKRMGDLMMLLEDEKAFQTWPIGSPEAMAICPQAVEPKDGLSYGASEEDMELLRLWEEKRAKFFDRLKVRPESMWNDEYDRLTENLKIAAEKRGYLLTPVVYIDGELVLSGKAMTPCDMCHHMGHECDEK